LNSAFSLTEPVGTAGSRETISGENEKYFRMTRDFVLTADTRMKAKATKSLKMHRILVTALAFEAEMRMMLRI
jgi:hypothetical protein